MCDLRLNVNPHGPEELEEGKGRVLAPQRLQYASDDNSAPNEEREGSLLVFLELLPASGRGDWTLTNRRRINWSKASLDSVPSLPSPRTSSHLKEARSPALGGGPTCEHDIECREAEADVAGTTVGIYTVGAESDGPDGPGGRFADVCVVLEGEFPTTRVSTMHA
ncbi:hypothetical protein CgunFtcFv8_010825 [Champsocephalus gunnari]|uniref:Uncharacterized protein n=1 Tax=Champsocephalus gunnari TaxID=52237 RepID=A0AAN8DWT2_CHAGU|nr:hypothetical protein CgunFtcFv8_010825 [Champsocephalus gunnari]